VRKDPFRAWRQAANYALRRGWAIGLEDAGISDEELLKHFQDGVRAAEFAQWFAEKYDLIDFSEVRLPLHQGYR
jgi:hypothetical protein